ncbi:FkbM family methyltransferase [Lichenihabitans psoromatis]|uniref:FkbM family methyltransferase n=2 Tax=Lichenihabitans psoromatis TaxID=2528642 RepID=UPI0013F16926|nr:FkbM family methyltransferase [Lichenihabitans psoromatis]
MRRNIIATVSFGPIRFRMEMFENDWGPEDPILNDALNASFDENVSLAWWMYFARTAADPGVFFDVGAYSGLYSLIIPKVRQDHRVVAMEPSSITYGRLVRNLQLNILDPAILAANIAAWNTDEQITFKHPFGIYTMCPGESALGFAKVDHTVSARAIPLDSLVSQRSDLKDYVDSASYDFMPARNVIAVKIDVEGVEPRVIEGAMTLIEQHRPFIICEALNEPAKQALRALLLPLRYSVIDVDNELNLIFIPTEKFEASRSGFANWCAAQPTPLVLTAQPEMCMRVDPLP